MISFLARDMYIFVLIYMIEPTFLTAALGH